MGKKFTLFNAFIALGVCFLFSKFFGGVLWILTLFAKNLKKKC